MIGKIGAIFLLLVVAKVVYNTRNLLWTKYHFKKYNEYINSGGEGWYIRENRQSIIEMFEKAWVKDNTLTVVEPLGYGHAQAIHVRAFQNIANLREDVAVHIISSFKEAQSIFRRRILQAFSLFYWVETFIFLPKKVTVYLGLDAGSVSTRILQLVWWLMNLAGIIGSTIFNQEFRAWSNLYLP